MITSYKSLAALFFACSTLNADYTKNSYSQEFGIIPDCNATIQTKPELHRPNSNTSSVPTIQEGSISHGINPWHLHNRMMNEILGHQYILKPTLSTESCTKYFTWQRQGDISQLKKHRHILRHKLKHAWVWQKAEIQRHINFITDLLNAPLTKALATIKTGGLAEAEAILRKLETQFGCAEGMFQLTQKAYDEEARARMVNGFDCIDAARTLFKNRADYPQFLERKQRKQEEKRIRSLVSYATPELLAQAIDQTADMIELYDQHNLERKDHLEKRITTLKEISDGNIIITHQKYMLSDAACILLSNQNLDATLFKKCSGDQFKQIMHQECTEIVEHVTQLLTCNIMFPYIGALLQLADAARESINRNIPLEAMDIANVCWTLLDYDKAILKGISNGLSGAIKDIREHPIETIVTAIAGKGVLAYQLLMLTCDALDLAFLAVESPQAASDQLEEYIKPITQVITQIEKKQISTQQIVTGTTEIGTRLLVQSMVLGGLNEFYTTTLNRAAQFLEKNPFAPAKQYLATADGQLLKTASGAGNASPKINSSSPKAPNIHETTLNQSSLAILKDGYYEVNGFKFTEHYYTKLWNMGRKAPSLIAKEILDNANQIIPDPKGHKGFFKYFCGKWEMVYNPTTKIVSHLQPIK